MQIKLQSKITCPNCWHRFFTHDALWIAAHPDLTGDPRTGGDQQQRFLPTRFTLNCEAVDVKGMPCTQLACPGCHLPICRALLELRPVFVSILGAPGSGKSYYLAAMTRQFRRMLQDQFSLFFRDADPSANMVLLGYEELLFKAEDVDQYVYLVKTQEQGDHYQQVSYGSTTVNYPKPFFFIVQPDRQNGRRGESGHDARLLCLYDNAGENYLPGGESITNPGTQHLAHSSMLFFLFDPTQDRDIRDVCRKNSNDPQLSREYSRTYQQHAVLNEAANRVRTHTGLSQNEKHTRPLIVVVTKADVWGHMLRNNMLERVQFIKQAVSGEMALDVSKLDDVSRSVRKLLKRMSPEIVAAAEAFSNEVKYIPVSALGGSPHVTRDPAVSNKKASDGGHLSVRPKDVRPRFVEVPMLYALHRTVPGMIRVGRRRQDRLNANSAPAASHSSTSDDVASGPPK